MPPQTQGGSGETAPGKRDAAAIVQTPLEESQMSRRSKGGIAARAGRWSARHRKLAIFGWLAVVIAAFALGGPFGTGTDRQVEVRG